MLRCTAFSRTQFEVLGEATLTAPQEAVTLPPPSPGAHMNYPQEQLSHVVLVPNAPLFIFRVQITTLRSTTSPLSIKCPCKPQRTRRKRWFSAALVYTRNSCFSRYRIGPVEVENALAEHPAVAESAVVSSPDKDRGEVRRAQKPFVACRSWRHRSQETSKAFA
jgi:hypothetical protein